MGLKESSEQQDVVSVLRKAGIFFCAVPNGGYRGAREARRLVAEGVEAGAPDLLIFDRPPHALGSVGVALEMKRRDGRASDLRPCQAAFLGRLRECGWVTVVAYGRDDALRRLTALGYRL